jgi:mannosyltransferase OCH1-like enzyme
MDLPKKIHFTCPNKNKIENPIWVECLNKYYELYDDYEIILYDDSDI